MEALVRVDDEGYDGAGVGVLVRLRHGWRVPCPRSLLRKELQNQQNPLGPIDASCVKRKGLDPEPIANPKQKCLRQKPLFRPIAS